MAPQWFSKRDLWNELLKCGKDPIYFINNYCKIIDTRVGHIVLFKTFDYQKVLIKKFMKNPRNIILKARQLGISTIVAAYCAWLLFFQPDREIVIIATQFDVAQNLVEKVKKIIFELDPFFNELAHVSVDNKKSFRLSNGSKLLALPANPKRVRSHASALLIIDEAAFIDGMEELWTGAEAVVERAGGRVIALSTPNGAAGWFYNVYQKAIKGENDFIPTKLL